MTPSQPDWTRFRIYAVRRAGGDGWSFVHIQDGCTALAEGLAGRGLLPESQVEIAFGATDQPHEPIELLPFEQAFDRACGRGWCYDYRAGYWRAPDEAITPPAPGPHVDRLDLAFTPPEWGCIDLRFTAGPQSFEIRLSNTWDRLPDLVEWLERVWAGGTPRYWFDVEASELEFHLWPHEAGLHLLIAHNTSVGRYEEIDVVIPRAALVQSIYRALVAYWESPALVDNWCHWASYTEAEGVEVDERGYELHPYALRSPTLDRALAGSI